MNRSNCISSAAPLASDGNAATSPALTVRRAKIDRLSGGASEFPGSWVKSPTPDEVDELKALIIEAVISFGDCLPRNFLARPDAFRIEWVREPFFPVCYVVRNVVVR